MNAPGVVQAVMDSVGGYQPRLFAQKILTTSDVNRHQNRLLIRQRDVINLILPQLSEVEKQRAKLVTMDNIKASSGTEALELRLYTEPDWYFTVLVACCDTGGLVLRGSELNMLLHRAGQFQVGGRVQIWSFRKIEDNELCLIIASNNAA